MTNGTCSFDKPIITLILQMSTFKDRNLDMLCTFFFKFSLRLSYKAQERGNLI